MLCRLVAWARGLRLLVVPVSALAVAGCSKGSSNQPPAATAQVVVAAQDVPIAVTLAATDSDGDALSFAVSALPEHGTISGTPPLVTYAPSAGYSGPDAFTFTASDGNAASAAVVTLNVVPAAGPVVTAASALDAALARVVAGNGTRGGLSVAIAKDGVLVFARGYGLADRAAGVTFEPDALARIASCSKPFTSTAVMHLVEEGRLTLDARLFDVLTDLPLPQAADPRLSEITVRQLLSHTAGFHHPMEDPLLDAQVRLAGLAGVPAPPTCRELFGVFRTADLGYAPGTQFSYSNLGYCALSLVIENVTGSSYQDVVRTDVLAPIGIHDARFAGTRLADRAPGEVVYESGAFVGRSVFPEDGGAFVPWAYGAASFPTTAGAAAWIASAVDLTRFVDALDGRGTTAAFLAPATLATMTTPGTLWSDASLLPGWTFRFGVGMAVVDGASGARWWGHVGQLPGTGCHMWANDDGWSWAAVWNEQILPLYPAVWSAVTAAIDPALTGSATDLYPAFPSPELGPYLGQ